MISCPFQYGSEEAAANRRTKIGIHMK